MNDYTSIADLYDSYVTDTRDHAFWSRWAAQATGPILELTAGTGRATVALLRASTQPVVALDLAPAMLRRLLARFSPAPRPVWAVGGDMTRLPFSSEQFGLVVIPFNSLGELIETAERAAALRELRRVLAPTGRALVTLHDPAQRRQTLDGAVRRLGPFAAGERRLEVLVRGRLVSSDLAESEQTYRVLGLADQVLEERRLTLRFVLPDAVSLVGMAGEAGLEAEALFGDYDESPYAPGGSPFILAVLGRRVRGAGGWPDRCPGTSQGGTHTYGAGFTHRGRLEIEKGLRDLLAGPFKGTQIQITPERIRLLGEAVAVEEATFLLSGLKTAAGVQADAVKGLCLGVYRKQGQRWFAAAVQCMVPPPPPGR